MNFFFTEITSQTYLYQNNGKKLVPRCHNEWASNMWQIGAKSNNSRPKHIFTNAMLSKQWQLCLKRFRNQIKHQISQPNVLKIPI